MASTFTRLWRRAAIVAALAATTAVASAQNQPGGPTQPGGAAQPARPRVPVTRFEKAYPTGDRATSPILVERFVPTEVRMGDELMYEIRVTNLTRQPVEEVVLAEQFPAGFTPASVRPEPGRSEGGRAIWQWKSLAPGESAVITVSGRADRAAELTGCCTVTFSTSLCGTTKIVEPRLELVKAAPAEVNVCDEFPLRLTVGNPGSGVARNVKVVDTLPPGMTTADGRNEIRFDAGDLGPGQRRDFEIRVRVSKPGEYRNVARATEEGGLSADASTNTIARQCALTLTKTGPGLRYIGRPATFDITVTNSGDAPANNVMLVDAIPAGLGFASADSDGRFADGRVNWALGTIPPGAAKTVKVTVNTPNKGVFENTAVAKGYCCEAQGAARMEVRGVPAILLEVVDRSDPIEVGGTETYEIVVTNQGTADDTNIVITVTVPPEMQFVAADGPTKATVEGKVVRYAALPNLPSKARAVYLLQTKGLTVADVRLKVTLTSDVIETPVEETESTHVY